VIALQPDVDLGEVLVCLRQAIDRLELEFSELAAEFAHTRQWDREGYNTAADWMRFNCHIKSNATWNALDVGEQAGRMTQSIESMRAGDIGFAHLATMANTADQVGKAFDERKLLPLAQKHSPGKFYAKCLHYRHSVDAKKYAQEQSDQELNHHLSLTTAETGHLLIYGVLDPVGGAAVRTALEPLARRSGVHDGRKREQRLADALVELASGGKPATLQVTATVETLKAMAGAPAGEMEFAQPISSAAVQRMAWSCSLVRVLLDGQSMVIDVGRSKRLIDGALRRALAVRDKHCQWPGCERPASWCDGHHLVHWINGGETNLANCVLLCKRHHRMVHEGDWQLIKTDDGQIISVAPTVTFGLPRGPD